MSPEEQLAVIAKLGKRIGKAIPRTSTEKITDFECGYVLDEKNDVIGLKLRDYKLTSIPAELNNFPSLQTLDLGNNQIQDIPGDILDSRDAQKILAYVKNIKEQGAKYLNEGKMLVLGHGRVGKSSLIKSLLYIATGDEQYKFSAAEGITIGILRRDYLCNIDRPDEENSPFTLAVWDFGGQEVQHSTHEHFIQEAIVVIVLDMTDQDNRDHPGRNRTWKDDLESWLQRVKQLANGREDNVFLVLSKAEAEERVFSVEEVKRVLRDNGCGDFSCLEYYARQVSALLEGKQQSEAERKTAEKQRDMLIETIDTYIKSFSFYPLKFPTGWFELKEKIVQALQDAEDRSIGYIPKKIFIEFCQEYEAKYNEENSDDILKTITENLSIVSYFPEDNKLRDKIYRTDWIIGYLYKLIGRYLSDPQAPDRFDFAQFTTFFNTEGNANLTTELLEIFQALDLVIYDDENDNWIVPEFLPETPAPLQYWDEEELTLHRQWHYDWLPNSIFLQLMVKMANDPEMEVTPTSRNWFLVKCKDKDSQALLSRGSIELRMKGSDTEGLGKILKRAEDCLQKIHKKWRYEVKCEDIINKLPNTEGGSGKDHSVPRVAPARISRWEKLNVRIAVIVGILTCIAILFGFFGIYTFKDLAGKFSAPRFEVHCDQDKCETRNAMGIALTLLPDESKLEKHRLALVLKYTGDPKEIATDGIILRDQNAENAEYALQTSITEPDKGTYTFTFEGIPDSPTGYTLEYADFEPFGFSVEKSGR